MSEKYVALPHLPHLEDWTPEEKVTWDFELPPHVDSERLELNMGALRRIQAVAAFRASHVLSYSGETTQFKPDIKGIANDGTALTSLKGQWSSAPKSKQYSHDDAYGTSLAPLMLTYFKTRTMNQLNRSELASIVADGRDSGRSREERWATVLNTALNESLRMSARAHLLQRQEKPMVLALAGLYGLVGACAVTELVNNNPSAVAGDMSLIFGIIGLQAMRNKEQFGESYLRERRWSLAFYGGVQPDRYLAAHGLSRISRLIRARK